MKINISISQFILQNPLIYWSYQKLVGGDTARKLFIKNNVKPVEGKKILDIGCGPGNILDFLPKMDYYGFDIDADYIEAAKQNYGHRGTFMCSNIKEFMVPGPGTFDIVIAIGIIHHLNDEDAKNLFRIAKKALKPNGQFITLDGCFVKEQHIISRFLLKQDRGKHIRNQYEYEVLANHNFLTVNSVIEHNYFHIPYTLLIMECSQAK